MLRNYVHTKICTEIFITALFIIAKRGSTKFFNRYNGIVFSIKEMSSQATKKYGRNLNVYCQVKEDSLAKNL